MTENIASSSTAYPSVSIIIPTYKDWESLSLCLNSVLSLDYPDELIEVLIVNNDPNTPVPREFSKFRNVKVLKEAKAGSYAARNKGIRYSKGDVLAFTDSDCIVNRNWVLSAVLVLINNPGVLRLGGKIEITYKEPKPTRYELYDRIFSFKQESNVINRGYAVTANLFVYRAVFDQVGKFDESLLSGGDTEWGLRAREHGVPILYTNESIVYHPARSDFQSISKKSRRVTGGIYRRNKDKPFGNIRVLIKAFFPPINAWREINSFPNISMVQKLGVLTVVLQLKYLRIKDLVTLMAGLSQPTRS